jgi:hypothetical protein
MLDRIRGAAAMIVAGGGKCRFCQPHLRQSSTSAGKPKSRKGF